VHLQHGDQVSLNITAPNAAVKEVLEQHLPRLREMFAEQGLNLSQSDVRDQSAGQRDRNESGESGDRGRYTDQAEETTPVMMEMDVPVGMVDYYA
jgi:flagellar hook-length control protein FliK